MIISVRRKCAKLKKIYFLKLAFNKSILFVSPATLIQWKIINIMSVFVAIRLPASLLQNVTHKSCLVWLENEKYVFGVTLRPLGSIGRSKQLQGLKFKIHKIKKKSLIKVVWYVSLMIKIPLIGRLTHCVVSGELQIEPGKAEQYIINLEILLEHFTILKDSEARSTAA